MRLYYFGIYENNGGLENFGRNLLRAFLRLRPDLQITILATMEDYSYREELEALGCETVILPSPQKRPLSFYRSLRSVLKRASGEDVLQLNICSYRNPFLFRAAKKSKIRTIVVGHYTKIDDGRVPFMHYLNRRIYSSLGLSISNSDDVGKFMFNGKEDYTILNGIDLERFRFSREARVSVREKLGYRDDEILLGQIGRICSTKNQIFSIQVVEELHKKFPSVRLVLVGIEKEPEPRDYVNQHGLGFVKFVGPVTEGINDYYSAFDLLFLPSKNEGLSLSLLESAANGLHAFYSTAVPHLKIEQKTGHFLDLEKDLWVMEIGKIIETEAYLEERKNLLKNSDYDIDVCAKKYLDLFERFDSYLSDAKRRRSLKKKRRD